MFPQTDFTHIIFIYKKLVLKYKYMTQKKHLHVLTNTYFLEMHM
jgi:hypothetical protein